MTDYAGWFDCSGGVAADERAARTLAPRTFSGNSVVLGPAGALMSGGRARLAHDDARKVAALVSGHPRWLDAALATTASRDGDAEALVAAYLSYGEGLIERLGGTFALAVIDGQRSQALLAIDRMGVERLCYSVNDGLLDRKSVV